MGEMKLQIRLNWHQEGIAIRRALKAKPCYDLAVEYCGRISRFMSCEITGVKTKSSFTRPQGTVWFCDCDEGSKQLSSRDVAELLRRCVDSSSKELHILIGGPDGFRRKDYDLWKPDLRWSFGRLTLPHELATVVALEQVYRGLTILKGLPYHLGH